MEIGILYQTSAALIIILIFLGIIIFYTFGRLLFKYQKKRNPNLELRGWGPLEGALLGLFSLLLSFNFSKSASNYADRRHQIVHEANMIETVLLRINLYDDTLKKEFRNYLKQYIETRIDYFDSDIHDKRLHLFMKNADSIADKFLARANEFLILPTDVRSSLMLPALTDMIHAAKESEEGRRATTPESILWLLISLCLAGIFIVGYTNKSHKADWVILLTYSAMTLMTIFIILDLDRPNRGIVTTHTAKETIYELLKKFE